MDRYQNLLEEICSLVWTTDATGNVIEPQPSWQAYTGQSYEEAQNYGWANAILETERNKVINAWVAAIGAGKIYQVTARIYHAASQSYHLVESTAKPIYDDDGTLVGWCGAMIDIEDKAAHVAELEARDQEQQATIAQRSAELASQQQLLETMLASTKILLVMVDLDGNYTYANNRALEVFSQRLDSVIGRNWRDLGLPKAASKSFESNIKQAILNKTDIADKVWIPTAGRLRLYGYTLSPVINNNSQIAGLVCSAEDITERDAAEQAIRSSEERLRLLTDALPILISYVDHEHRYQYNNPQYAITFNRPLSEITGQHISTVIGEDSYQTGLPRIQNALNGKEQHFDMDFTDDNGLRHYMQGSYIPHREKHQVVGFFAMVSDITMLKNAEKQNLEHERELAHMHRISSLGEMASNMAHELNQPLTAIASYASVSKRLIQGINIDKDYQEDIEKALTGVEKQSHRAADIIKKVRAFVRKRPIESRCIDLNKTTEEAIELANLSLKDQGIEIRFETIEDQYRVQADGIQIQQIIMNLLMNAAEVTPPATDLWEPRYIDVSIRALRDHNIKLDVRDYGNPITQQELEGIFEPFYSTKDSGMGMGLAISTSIAEAHGGRLEAFANEDTGVTMSLTLPSQTE